MAFLWWKLLCGKRRGTLGLPAKPQEAEGKKKNWSSVSSLTGLALSFGINLYLLPKRCRPSSTHYHLKRHVADKNVAISPSCSLPSGLPNISLSGPCSVVLSERSCDPLAEFRVSEFMTLMLHAVRRASSRSRVGRILDSKSFPLIRHDLHA